MYETLKSVLQKELKKIQEDGLYKKERIITSPQSALIQTTETQGDLLNFCANNYLGLSSHPKVIEAAKKTIDTHGYGLSSVRFICGTQDIHKQLEKKIADLKALGYTVVEINPKSTKFNCKYQVYKKTDAGIKIAMLDTKGNVIGQQG
jgi:glycine C-acetyltransferase